MKLIITVDVDDALDFEEIEELREDIFNDIHSRGGDFVSNVEISEEEEKLGSHETNAEFLARVTDEAPKGGAFTGPFAIDAISKHANKIAAMTEEEGNAAFGEQSFVSFTAWQLAAFDWKDAIDNR